MIAGFGYDDCPPRPAWMAPREWLGEAGDLDLHLVSNQPRTRLHSQWDHGSTSRNAKISGLESVRMHPDDAELRGIEAGDVVRLFNARGACLAGVSITNKLRRGVVELATGAWYSPGPEPDLDGTCLHGNPNTLTSDAGHVQPRPRPRGAHLPGPRREVARRDPRPHRVRPTTVRRSGCWV